MNNQERFLEIASLLHPTGSRHAETSPRVRRTCWVAADGYGRMTWAELQTLGLTSDWSHIRDASDEALSIVWQILQAEGLVDREDDLSGLEAGCLAFWSL